MFLMQRFTVFFERPRISVSVTDLAYYRRISDRWSREGIYGWPLASMAFETTQAFGDHLFVDFSDPGPVFRRTMAEVANFPAAGTNLGPQIGNKTVADHTVGLRCVIFMEISYIGGAFLFAMAHNASVSFRGCLQVSGLVDIRVVAFRTRPPKRAQLSQNGTAEVKSRMALLTVVIVHTR